MKIKYTIKEFKYPKEGIGSYWKAIQLNIDRNLEKTLRIWTKKAHNINFSFQCQDGYEWSIKDNQVRPATLKEIQDYENKLHNPGV